MKMLTRATRSVQNVSITKKSVAVFASLLIVVLGLGAQSILRLGMVKAAGDTISARWMPGVQRAGEIAEAANTFRDAESTMVLTPDDDSVSEMKKSLALSLKQIHSSKSRLPERRSPPCR